MVLGGMLLVVGIALVLGAKLPLRLGRLPGDMVYQGRHGAFYFPIVTCLVLSVLFTLLMWVVGLFRR